MKVVPANAVDFRKPDDVTYGNVLFRMFSEGLIPAQSTCRFTLLFIVEMFGPYRSVTTNILRARLSDVVNRAAFGDAPVVVTRRGHPVAAIISIEEFGFFTRMKKKRDELRRQPLPSDPEQIGPALAQKLRDELDFY